MSTSAISPATAVLPLSTFLDFSGYRITNKTTVEEAYGFRDGELFDNASGATGFNMALMLERTQDPAALLSQPWSSRQQQLNELNKAGALWSTYGSDPGTFVSIASQLQAIPYEFTLWNSENSAYVSSPESRTIWIKVDSGKKFETLFGTPLYYSGEAGLAYWNGPLSLPADWPIAGLWLDISTAPNASNLTSDISGTLQQGPQSPGNSTATSLILPPQTIASELYNFPLAGQTVNTGVIGLIEPGVGTGLPQDPSGEDFSTYLQDYLEGIGQTSLSGSVDVVVQGVPGQLANQSGERSIDIGIVAAINPNSTFTFFNGSGGRGLATSSVFTTVQSAAWAYVGTTQQPQVTTNSWGDAQSMTPGSPFYNAYWAIFEDAALNNQTTVIALGDGGSGNETANGLTNVETNITQPYNLIVSGTSLSTLGTALGDPTLSNDGDSQESLTTLALSQDRSTLWSLMQAGLNTLPSVANPQKRFLEAVWNSYVLSAKNITGPNTYPAASAFDFAYIYNSAASGGVDPTQAAPAYQANYGLSPTTTDSYAQSGRGVPDVSANAGGNLYHQVPIGEFVPSPTTRQFVDSIENGIGLTPGSGTSSAAPFWASLIVQINAIFKDIYGENGPNQLGYFNDLLYTASVVGPAGFNDIQVGNNTSSYFSPGSYSTGVGDQAIQLTPTNFGYQASPGYDLVTGLGSPNGTRLAITLANIANIQLSTSAPPAVLQLAGASLSSGTNQTLQFQVSGPAPTSVEITVAGAANNFVSSATAAYAWTSQLAQQSLQVDFDPNLIRLFDGASQGSIVQSAAGTQAPIQVQVAHATTATSQYNLSNAYGFVDFSNSSGVVRTSRPVSIATTTNNSDDSDAVIRMRQNGADMLSIFCYKVDDLTGVINGILPNQAGYASLALSRRYRFSGGNLDLQGPGHGNYSQGILKGVDSGDLIALGLTNQTHGQTYFSFAEANEKVAGAAINHLWNYGMNVFGFEDTFGGGDRDFNDAIVELDFASASGSGLLINPL